MMQATTGRQAVAVQRPSFFGLIGGELFKVTRMWSIWISLVLMLGGMCLPFLITLTVTSQKNSLLHTPLHFFYDSIELNFFVLRVFIGFFLLILTASVFGREYQAGTIRVLLARGVGRVQLLWAKLVAVVLIALFALALGLLLDAIGLGVQMLVFQGNFNALQALDSVFWHNIGVYVLTILVSMGATILLAVVMTAIGRSFVFGLSASLVFFPIDNIGTIFMRLGYELTKNDFWKNVTAYFLGPNLNEMPSALLPKYFENEGASPLVQVDGTHTLVVALVYAVIFLLVAVVLTWRRDVKE
jgi:ABC-2 type transport system permease protein